MSSTASVAPAPTVVRCTKGQGHGALFEVWSSPAGHRCEHLRFSPHENPVFHHFRDTSEGRHAEPIAVHIFATTQQSPVAQLVELQVSGFQMVVHRVRFDPVTSRSRGLLYRKGSQSSFGRCPTVQFRIRCTSTVSVLRYLDPTALISLSMICGWMFGSMRDP